MWSLGLQSVGFTSCLNIGLVIAGDVVSSLGDLKLELGGVLYQVLGLVLMASDLGLTRKLLSGDNKINRWWALDTWLRQAP